MVDMGTALRARTWTVDEYHRIAAAGVLGKDDRVELIEGDIVEMTPIGARHAASVNAIVRSLVPQAGSRFVVSVQNPVRLGSRSEPQPDVVVLSWRDDGYADELPTASDVRLVIEVADSSLSTDRDIKLPLYATAGIPETWLINLAGGRFEVHLEPSPTGYSRRRTYHRGESVASTAAPGLVVEVAEALLQRR